VSTLNFKKQVDILKDMVGYTSAISGTITDFMVGSGVRTMYDAFSIELEELYMLTRSNIMEGIEKGLMQSYDFVPKPARRAYGQFRVTFIEPLDTRVTIPRGTKITSSKDTVDVVYETLVDYVVDAGLQEAYFTAYCTETGTVGNVSAGDMDVFPYALYKVDSVVNVEDILTGAEEASYEDTKKLFKLFVESRGRATRKALEYGTLAVDEISGAYVAEKIGINYVYCHDSNGNLSEQLRQKVINNLQDYRPAGIELSVLPIVKYVLDVDITLVVEDINQINALYQDRLEKFIKQYLNEFTANQDLVLADFIQNVMNFDDTNVYDCYFNDLAGNVLMNNNEIIRAGDIKITYRQRTEG